MYTLTAPSFYRGLLLYLGKYWKIMVTVNELRIGNSVFAFGKGNIQVKSIEPTGINGNLAINLVKGIDITPGVLERCGFKKQDYDENHFANTDGWDVTVNKAIYTFHFPSLHEGEIDFRFLHQFQNLFFHLIGEELNIALT
jgi:hypothetical protein